MEPGTPARPTRVRYLIVAVAMLAAVLLYLERVCVSVAEVYIREDLRIDKARMDLAFGAFFFAYALGQVPSGWLSQRYGPRLMLTLYMIGWSVFGVFIALAQDFPTLFLARFLLGLSQAGAYPTMALLVKRWFPDRHRGLASGVVAFGGRFGGAGASLVTAMLIVAFVPSSAPQAITPGDVLDPVAFGVGLLDHRPGPLETARDAVRVRLVGDMAGPGPTAAAAAAGGTATFFTLTPEPIAAGVNARVQGPDLTGGKYQAFGSVRSLLANDGKTIFDKPDSERTAGETMRLNRLVIEKVFPGAIRQLHGLGWRPTLASYGVLGILVAVLVWVFTRDWPRLHLRANAAEVGFIESGQSHAGEAASTAIPFRALIASRNQWLMCLNQFTSNYGWVFLVTLMPRYLEKQFNVPVDTRGLMTTVPLLVASFAVIAGGWATDRLTRSYGRRWGRAVPIGGMKLPCAVLLLALPFAPNPWVATALLTGVAVSQDFGIPAGWAFAQDTGGKQAGVVLGWANMWGNFGAGIAILVTGRLAEAFGWDAAFFNLSAAFLVCAVSGLLLNANRPLFPPGEAHP